MTAPTVLIAPDKFKGSLTARQVADALAEGLRGVIPEAGVRLLPLADGGDGSVEAALSAGYRGHRVGVTGPLGDPATTTIAFDGRTAVVEAATTSGLQMVPADRREARAAGSQGFGQAIRAAIELGAQRVVLALGGSASTDGGLGMLTALGWRFRSADGAPVPPSGLGLADLATVDAAEAVDVSGVELIAAGDVRNPLLGVHGAAAVYGPQKGADAQDVAFLDAGLTRLVEVAGRVRPETAQLALRPAAGAAGGLGFAAMILGARTVSGADFFLDLLDFEDSARGCDLVITGEGRIDTQTLSGKLPAVVARRASPTPVVAVVGLNALAAEAAPEAGISRIWSLSSLTEADTSTDPVLSSALLVQVGREIAGTL